MLPRVKFYENVLIRKMIASFDIGEKNFAYAIGTKDTLVKWRHVNVMEKKRQTVVQSCIAITEVLEKEDWTNCKVIIEQQMRTNSRASRLAQHVWSYFYLVHPESNPTFIPAHRKTQFFLGKNSLSNKERKKWSVEMVREILTGREDNANLTYLESLPKKDDVADTLLQLMAHLN